MFKMKPFQTHSSIFIEHKIQLSLTPLNIFFTKNLSPSKSLNEIEEWSNNNFFYHFLPKNTVKTDDRDPGFRSISKRRKDRPPK